jgi:hypothetical protein
MNWTKPIQFGERLLQTPLLKLPGSCLCPVTAYDNMLKVIPGKSSDALFLLPNGKPVTCYLFQNKLRQVLNDLGFDSSLYSSNSFRRGFATLTFKNNINSDEIQILGDWHSDVYKRYISLSIEDKCKIIKDISHVFYV